MKVLVFGAGLIGTTYAWQLHEAGADVSLLVRKQRKVRYEHSGVPITYTDTRKGQKDYGHTVFRPEVIDRLTQEDQFDFILVTLRSNQWNDAIPYLSKYSGNAHIVFLGNLWDEYDMIEKHFPKGRYLLAYPEMVAGGYTGNSINTYLFRHKHTYLGEPDGKKTERLNKLADLLASADLRPKISSSMKQLLPVCYLHHAILSGLISKAGGAGLFVKNNLLVKQYLCAFREGLRVLRKRGVKPAPQFPFNLSFLPLFVITWLVKRTFTPEVQAALDAHMKHGTEEKKKQYYNVLQAGKKERLSIPYWTSFEKYMDFS